MNDDMRLLVGVVGGPLFLVGLSVMIFLIVREHRRHLARVEAAWSAYGQSKGFAFSPNQGLYRFDSRLGVPPRVRGVAEGISFTLELVGYRRLRGSQVLVAMQTPLSMPGRGTTISPDQLGGDAARAWARLAALRPDSRMAVWQHGGQQVVAVGWGVPEQDPVVLDQAVALAVALGRSLPAIASARR